MALPDRTDSALAQRAWNARSKQLVFARKLGGAQFSCCPRAVVSALRFARDAAAQNTHNSTGRELHHIGDDVNIGVDLAHGLLGIAALQAAEMECWQAVALAVHTQHVGFGPGFFWYAEHAR